MPRRRWAWAAAGRSSRATSRAAWWRRVGAGVAADFAPVGARVMNHHYKGCGRCKHCRVGWSQLCRSGITVYGMTGHGGHAPFMKAPAFTMVPLPDELSFEEGAAISCGTGTAYGALKRIDVSGRDTLAVFGQGPVGLSATMLGHAMGARVIAVDVSAERLALAKEFGADAVVNSKETDPVEAIHELTHGEGAETTMDCTGVAEARVAAVRSAGTWGRVALVGEGGTTTFDISQHLLRRQLTIHASWTFSAMGQAECARFIVDKKVPLEEAPDPPLQAGRGRRGLQALRHADDGQGRLRLLSFAVLGNAAATGRGWERCARE